MLKLDAVERNWRALLEVLDGIGEHLRQSFGHYDKVFRRCDRYFMQKHGRRADTLQDIIVILNCRDQARAQVFLNESDFQGLSILLNQFYKLREVHNSVTADILKPLYRYYYLYFSQDKQHERQLENFINAANTAKIFISSVEQEGDKKSGPKPFGKEDVKPHQKVWHVLSFLENSLLGLRPILEEVEDWQMEHRVHLHGQEIDFLQPLLSYRYGRGPQQGQQQQQQEGGSRRTRGRQQRGAAAAPAADDRDNRRWEDQLRIHGEPIKAAPAFPKRYGGMVNNYLSAREDYYLQQRLDSYWDQEAAMQEWRRRGPLLASRPRQQRPLLAIAAAAADAGLRYEDAGTGRTLVQLVDVRDRPHGPSVFITEEAPGQQWSETNTPRILGVGIAAAAAAGHAPAPSPAGTPPDRRQLDQDPQTMSSSLPPLVQPGAPPRVTTDDVRAVRGFDPDTYLEELKGTEMKLQVVRAALKQQEAESAELLAKMTLPGRGMQEDSEGEQMHRSHDEQSFDWLRVLHQEKETNIHSLRKRVELLNFQKKLILSRLQAPLFTY